MKPINTDKSLRSTQLMGYASIAVMLGLFGTWTALADMNGAVIAPATIVSESYSKKVQHREGGNVLRILVKDGDVVQAGQDLVQLDPTETKAELGILDGQNNEFLIRKARLEAQRDGLKKIELPAVLAERATSADIAQILAGQNRLLESTLETANSKKGQLLEQLGQLKEQIAGIGSQIVSSKKQLDLISKEVSGLRGLQQKGLVPASRVMAMDRETARIEGERGQLVSSKASAEAKIGEVKLLIIQVAEELRNQALIDLRDTDTKLGELAERRISAAARLSRMSIRAPITGTVYQLAVHTEGGVVAPNETIMMVLPQGDDLVLQAQVSPNDISHVQLGQPARIRFTAFNSRITPEIAAEVTQVAADTSRADAQSPPFYAIRLTISAEELKKLGENKLKPGMGAEAFITTESRSPFSYLVKPLVDQWQHSMRES
jgi:HlyD family secretion protein